MLVTEFAVISLTLRVSFAWGLLLLLKCSITQSTYEFSVFQTSLLQLTPSAGAVVSTIFNTIQDKLYLQSAKRKKENPGQPFSESRLYFSVLDSLISTAGLF